MQLNFEVRQSKPPHAAKRKPAQEKGTPQKKTRPPSPPRYHNSHRLDHKNRGAFQRKNAAENGNQNPGKGRMDHPDQEACHVRGRSPVVLAVVVAAAAAATEAVGETPGESGGELGGARLGGRFFAVLLALVLLLRLELARLRLLLERLDARGLPLLLVDRLHQNTLVLELVTLASQVAAEYQASGNAATVGRQDAEQQQRRRPGVGIVKRRLVNRY